MKNFNLIIYFVISKFYGLFIIAHCKDSFNENLKVKPLSHNLVQVEFEFILRRFFNRSSVDIYQYRNFDIFPRSFAQLVEPSNVSEFKVSLTQGNWRWKQWGAPISEAAPFGGRLTAWFDVDDSNLHDISLLREEETQLQSQWKLLSSSLSGYLCGSFSFIEDQHNTFSPSFSFEPTGKAHFSSEGSYKREQLLLRTHKSKRYSMWLDSLFSSSVSKKNPCEKKRANQKLFLSHYPIERVCTENLLPLLRLLPCRSAQGLSSLIDPSKLFSAKYTSLSLFWKRYCPYEKSLCDVRSGELVVTVSYVTEREPLSLGNSLLHFLFKNSFSQLDSCALAEQSYVSFDPDGSGIFAITKTIQEVKDGLLMDENNTFLQKEKEKEKERKYWLWDSKFPVEMERRLTGSGKQKRGILVHLRNNMKGNISVTYLETLPWQMQPFLHSLAVTSKAGNRENILQFVNYIPSIDRNRSALLELVCVLPSASEVTISFDMYTKFLRYLEYPYDPHRGFHMGPAALIIRGLPAEFFQVTNKRAVVMYSSNLVVLIPAPDFSMPYNVVSLTSVLLTFFFTLLTGNVVRMWKVSES